MTDEQAVVGVIMGSSSDLEHVEPCLELLEELQIPHDVTVASAHRTPQRAAEYAREARERGIRVLIAAAGWSAHLPGVLAAHTTLPVVGLPIGSSPLGGNDALYAMVQMPPGVPVATVGINTGRNAAILAAQILAVGNEDINDRLIDLKQELKQKTEDAAEEIESHD